MMRQKLNFSNCDYSNGRYKRQHYCQRVIDEQNELFDKVDNLENTVDALTQTNIFLNNDNKLLQQLISLYKVNESLLNLIKQ